MTFYEDGDELLSVWHPESHFQGYLNILHGGILATLMDEIASWTVYVKHKAAGVTSKMEIRFLKAVFADKGQLTIRSRIVHTRRNLIDMNVRLFDNEGQLCSEAMVTYFTYSEKKSRESLYYPDHSAFFEDHGN
jgi:uncharacterized protein (TIGR00369 family)